MVTFRRYAGFLPASISYFTRFTYTRPLAVKNIVMNKGILLITNLIFCIVQLQSQSWSQKETVTFETIPLPIVIDSTSENIWQIGTPSKSFMNMAYSPPLSIVTDTINPYPINNKSCFTLILNENEIPWVYSYSTISFMHKYDTDTLNDGGFVELSYDDGYTWYNVVHDTISLAYPEPYFMGIRFNNFYSAEDTLTNGIPAFSGKSKGWEKSSIVYEYGWVKKSYPSKVMFKFCFQSDQNDSQKEGWIIDDIILDVHHGTNIKSTLMDQVQIFPNPLVSQSIIRSSTVDDEILNVKIFDYMGRLVHYANVDASEYMISRDDLSPGLYILQVEMYRNMSTSILLVK